MMADHGLASIEPLTGDANRFAGFAFPQQRALLAALPPDRIAIGIRWRSTPAGLALLRVEGTTAVLELVVVDTLLHRRGLATRAVVAAMAAAAARGTTTIAASYPGDLADRAGLEKVLARAGFAPSFMERIQLVGGAAAMVAQVGAWPMIARGARLLDDCAIEPLSLDRADDDAAIAAILAANPKIRVDHPRDTGFDPSVSRVLRRRGAIVGWVAGHRLRQSIGPGTIVADAPTFYFSGARIADGQPRSLMVLLYHRAFAALAEAHGPRARIVYMTSPNAPAMYAFTRARFAPIALRVDESWAAVASLDPERLWDRSAGPEDRGAAQAGLVPASVVHA